MSAPRTELVERESELGALTEVLSRTERGASGVLVITGVAGAGKSVLLNACVNAARNRGYTILEARSRELEQDHVLGVVRRLTESADGTGTDVTRSLLDALDAAPDGLDRTYGLAHRLSGEIARAAEAAPVLICVDDAQWSDPASLKVLHYLASRADGQRLLIALGIRTGESEDPTLVALAAPPATVLHPGPLSLAGTTQVISAAAGSGVTDQVIAECHRTSSGNPFFVAELARALADDPTGAGLPTSVSDFVRERLARRSSAARRTAEALAVLGDGAAVHHVAAMTGESADTVLEAAVELARSGILGTERALTFAHPLVADAVRSDLDPNLRALSHRRAADLLAVDGAPVTHVAAHLLHTIPAGQEGTVGVLLEAAGAATARGAAGSAVPLLRRALQEPPIPAQRGTVLTMLGAAELETGALPSALEHLREGFGLADRPADLAQRAVALALATTATEGMQAATDVLDAAMARLPDDEPALRLELEAHAIRLSLFDARLYERGWGRLAELPEPAGTTPAERAILALKSIRESFFGGTAGEAGRLARLACSGGLLAEDPGFDSIPFGIAMSAACEAGELAFAMDELERARGRAQARNAPGDLAVILGARALVDHRQGDLRALDETVALARMALSAAVGSHLDVALAPLMGATEAVVRAEAGDFAGADAALASGGMLGPVGEDPNTQRLVGWRIRGDLALGRYDRVREDVAVLRRHQSASGIEWDPSAPWRAWLAQVEGVAGNTQEARELAERDLELSAHWGTPFSHGISARARAYAERGPAAIPWLAEAAEGFAAAGDAVEHARAEVHLGEAFSALGQIDEARHRLARGMDGASAAGAARLAARAREGLIRTGARPRRERTSGVDSLTGAERRVTSMAADGLANREIAQALFVSIKTVEGHLRSAYAKLGISRRGELSGLLPAAEQ